MSLWVLRNLDGSPTALSSPDSVNNGPTEVIASPPVRDMALRAMWVGTYLSLAAYIAFFVQRRNAIPHSELSSGEAVGLSFAITGILTQVLMGIVLCCLPKGPYLEQRNQWQKGVDVFSSFLLALGIVILAGIEAHQAPEYEGSRRGTAWSMIIANLFTLFAHYLRGSVLNSVSDPAVLSPRQRLFSPDTRAALLDLLSPRASSSNYTPMPQV